MACVAARPPAPSFTAAVSRLSATASSLRGAGARAAGPRRRIHGRDGEPVLQFGVEAVLGLAGLEVEEAEHERAGEAEQRGREATGPCPAAGAASEFFNSSKSTAASCPVRSDEMIAPDRADGVDEAPERAEQAEEHQQAGEVAHDLAALVEARADRIEERAGRRDRQGRLRPGRLLMRAAMGASRIGGLGGSTPSSGLPERVDPADLRKQAHRPAGSPARCR